MSQSKSSHNNKCISKCYSPGTNIVHPITLENVTHLDSSFCAVMPKKENNKHIILKKCDEYDSEMQDDDKLNILHPLILFDNRDFLQTYYQINDINDFYFWLRTNKNIPIFTKLRLFECILSVFGDDISIVEPIFVETIIDIIKKYWIKMMYSKLCKYIGYSSENEIQIMKPSKNKLTKIEKIDERTKYIISTFITNQNLTNIINNYFNNKKKDDNLNDFFNFILTSVEDKMKKL